jgi:hypothetical protein
MQIEETIQIWRRVGLDIHDKGSEEAGKGWSASLVIWPATHHRI